MLADCVGASTDQNRLLEFYDVSTQLRRIKTSFLVQMRNRAPLARATRCCMLMWACFVDQIKRNIYFHVISQTRSTP